tara:strand:+ start:409 stop:822 length:414 start_codon:yes stop_codon:yes gene_type:complete
LNHNRLLHREGNVKKLSELGINPEMFVSVNNDNWTPSKANKQILHIFKTLNGFMSDRRISKLLGCEPNYIWRWKTETYRPSQLYLARMLAVFYLKVNGLDLSLVKEINWKLDLVVFADVPNQPARDRSDQGVIAIRK